MTNRTSQIVFAAALSVAKSMMDCKSPILQVLFWQASVGGPSHRPTKVAPFLGPRFKEASGRMCQERRCQLPFRQPGRQFGKCRERSKRVKVICLSLRPLSLP